MIDRLKQQLPDDRFILLTPINTDSPIVSFAFKDAEKVLKPHLEGSGISISLYDHMIRISPSFYNDMDDIDKLIHVLRSVS
jgi:selenocysteine lyase/cysteine desulfurase